MKKMGKYLAAPVVALVILIGVLCFFGRQQEFVPILRFAVTGDVHIREDPDNDYGSRKQLAEFIRTAYAYSDAQTDYTTLDGMFFTGDNTNDGTKIEQTTFFDYVKENAREETATRAVLGNHEFRGTKTDGDSYSATSLRKAPVKFMEYSGYDGEDAHLVIKGYHFIFMSMDAYTDGIKFTDEKLAWLEGELASAAAEDKTGKKPIFVFQHEPPEGAVGGATVASGDVQLTRVLAKYPQVVNFSGHTHYDMTNPQAIRQEAFTALTTGSLAYLTVPIVGHPENEKDRVIALDKEGAWSYLNDGTSLRNAGMYYIVEVSQDGRVRVIRYDIFTDSVYGEPIYLEGIGEPDKFTLTDERAQKAAKPVFSGEKQITVAETDEDRIVLEIPQASCSTDPVQNYRIDTYLGDAFVSSTYRLACTFYGDATPETISAPISHLDPGTEYTLKVYAVGSWGQESEPFVLTASTLPRGEAAVYRWEFDGTEFSDVMGNNALTRLGGSMSDGVHKNSRLVAEKAVHLYHDRPWSIEWHSEGTWSTNPRLLTEYEFSGVTGSMMLCRRQKSQFISFGWYTGSRYESYGLSLSNYGIDGEQEHIFRLENRIAEDGSNMVWLLVDGEEIGPMNNYYIGTKNQDEPTDWVSGKDFAFRNLGDSQYPIGNCSMDYMEIVECNHSGEPSACTFCGQ